MRKGFTLVELIVVIAIIAILAAIIAPNAFRAIEKANVQKAIRDIKTMASAAMQHYSGTGRWPPPINTPPYGAGFLTNDDGSGNPVAGWDGPYLEKWPYHPWSRESRDATTYQWDHKDVATEVPGLEWTIEIGLSDLSQGRRDYIAGMIDKTLDNEDGPCAGTFRAYCPPGPGHWAGWPKYIAAYE
jgi:general secretion pathway protein G